MSGKRKAPAAGAARAVAHQADFKVEQHSREEKRGQESTETNATEGRSTHGLTHEAQRNEAHCAARSTLCSALPDARHRKSSAKWARKRQSKRTSRTRASQLNVRAAHANQLERDRALSPLRNCGRDSFCAAAAPRCDARSAIHVPTQNLHVDTPGASLAVDSPSGSGPSSHARQVSLVDLCAQVKHYSVNVRRDALLSMKDALARQQGTMQMEAPQIMQLVLPCLLDEERSVRGALLQLIGWMLPALGSQVVAPFQPLIVSYICSGMSHMHFAVRRSAMQALRILMDLEVHGASQVDAAGAAASRRLLWSNSYRQLLPNFLSCLTERVFVTKQSNIGSTELLAASSGRNRGGSSSAGALDAAAGSAGTNLANRAMMLQCIEQYMALCPYLNEAASTADSSADAADAAASTLPPHLLHSAALHSLLYPDASATTGAAGNTLDPYASFAGATADGAHAMLAATRVVPQKYARKQSQQNKFFVSPTAVGAASATASERDRSAQVLTSFIQDLLPITIEYWLESFGLTGGGGQLGGSASVGGMSAATLTAAGSASSAQAHNLKTRDHSDLLANLQAILGLIARSLDILRGQRIEALNHERIQSGALGLDGSDDTNGADVDTLVLPASFPALIRTHIFSGFPFGFQTIPSMAPATTNEQQYRALNLINAQAVGIMSRFMEKRNIASISSGGEMSNADHDSHQQPVQHPRRKSLSNRQAKQAAEDDLWLNAILSYMADSFHSLAEASQIKAASAAAATKTETKKEADDEAMDDVAAAAAPTTPARVNTSGRPASQRKSGGKKGASSSTRVMEHGSLADLLPLLQTLLPRLSIEKQDWMIDAFSNYYLSCHPLSISKLSCLRFLHGYLLAPPRGFEWLRVDALRARWIDQGEWSHLLLTVAQAIGEMREAERIKVEQARAEEEAEAGHAFVAAAADPSDAAASSPLLARYNELLHLLLSLLLRCGRIYHGIVLDFNLLQDQLLPFFGRLEQGSLEPVVAGPFWSLSAEQQHVSSQLLYYFDALSPALMQLLLECMRHASLPLQPKMMLLDLIEDKFHQSNATAAVEPSNGPTPVARWSVGSYVSFILGLIRPTVAAADSTSTAVSPLMEVACKMLRGITEVEIDASLRDTLPPLAAPAAPLAPVVRGARMVLPPQTQSSEVMIAPSSPAVLLELLAPLLSSTLQAALASSSSATSATAAAASSSSSAAAPKLDLLSTLMVLDSLLAHAGRSAALPPPLASLLPSACYLLLSRSLTGSMIEGGMVRAHAGWTSAPLAGFVSAGQGWMVALRMLHATADRGALESVLASMSSAFAAGAQQDAQAQAAAVVVLVSLTRCAGLREMLQQPPHQSVVLGLASSMQRQTGIASQTLMAALHSELALLFGQQAHAARL